MYLEGELNTAETPCFCSLFWSNLSMFTDMLSNIGGRVREKEDMEEGIKEPEAKSMVFEEKSKNDSWVLATEG